LRGFARQVYDLGDVGLGQLHIRWVHNSLSLGRHGRSFTSHPSGSDPHRNHQPLRCGNRCGRCDRHRSGLMLLSRVLGYGQLHYPCNLNKGMMIHAPWWLEQGYGLVRALPSSSFVVVLSGAGVAGDHSCGPTADGRPHSWRLVLDECGSDVLELRRRRHGRCGRCWRRRRSMRCRSARTAARRGCSSSCLPSISRRCAAPWWRRRRSTRWTRTVRRSRPAGRPAGCGGDQCHPCQHRHAAAATPRHRRCDRGCGGGGACTQAGSW
jgi:hypothetical protein